MNPTHARRHGPAGAASSAEPAGQPGTLILAAAPIGRTDDSSSRLATALEQAPVIAAEDTRRLRRLAAALGVTPAGRVVSYYEDVEVARGPALLAALAAGEDVLLVTDAGMPGISDPGYRLVTAAIAAGVAVTVLPGPSAVTAAVAVSGLPTDRFCFEGFPPRRAGERARRFASLRDERRTLVFFESPRRLAGTLAELAVALGADRRAVVCRELTKTHEEIRRGTLAELADWAGRGVLGEITLVVGGAPAPAGTASADDAAAEVGMLEQAGTPRKEAIAQTATRLGLPKREVYDAVIRARSRPAWP
ncbi:MAG TPA: 16S rRNA (cytidine(1402)-2'-O)-methyltransferase [Streptosporangiaceae bacterium]|nr:16S rRNA (cytidine(1402)-2'-O)-methyltransferase [Streptosporangiaceae bacterium]